MAFANATKTSHVQILKSKQLYQIPPSSKIMKYNFMFVNMLMVVVT